MTELELNSDCSMLCLYSCSVCNSCILTCMWPGCVLCAVGVEVTSDGGSPSVSATSQRATTWAGQRTKAWFCWTASSPTPRPRHSASGPRRSEPAFSGPDSTGTKARNESTMPARLHGEPQHRIASRYRILCRHTAVRANSNGLGAGADGRSV